MAVGSSTGRLLFYVAVLTLVAFWAVSCAEGGMPPAAVSPLSPTVTRTDPHSGGAPSSVEIGQVYAAQFRGSWASGYPYPVFFLDIPYGTARLTLAEVAYGSEEPLNQAHPPLDKVVQEVVWHNGSVSQLIAEDFYYDEVEGRLLAYTATVDGIPLDTVSYAVAATKGVGVAYLGDVGGVNVFYNCGSPTSIHYRELATDEDGRPTEEHFQWECEGDTYSLHVEVAWGASGAPGSIEVITGLMATITRR